MYSIVELNILLVFHLLKMMKLTRINILTTDHFYLFHLFRH